MRKTAFIAVFLLALAAAPCSFAQQMALPTHFGNWSGKPSQQWIETEAPLNYLKLWKESGRTTGEYCEYSSGTAKVDVSLEKYHDPSSAYEIYTALIHPEMHPSLLDRTSAVDGDRLFVLVGNSILEVRPTPAISTADLVALVNAVSAHSDQTPLPPIRAFLPKGFTDGTQKYALGPAGFQNGLATLKREQFAGLSSEAGFNSGAEAMLAEYRRGNDSAVVLLIEYPTPQLAEQHLHHLEQALPEAAKRAGVTVERKASLLSLVFAATSAEYARAIREAVNYETQVTWNERGQKATDPPIMLIMYKIFLFTGLFLGVATGVGIAFGGFRVIVKRMFPGKVFDRPEDIEVLQLGLSGKKIDPTDMY
jgi:hypothetical protein